VPVDYNKPLPRDEALRAGMVRDICYCHAKGWLTTQPGSDT
jgi:hypothetical protein